MTRFPIHANMTTTGPALQSLHRQKAYRDAFEARLARLVGEDTLGVFILALANANYDGAIFDRLHGALRTAFGHWCDRFDGGDPRAAAAAKDDVEVFARLRALGFGI